MKINKGDKVLIEAVVINPTPDEDGEILLECNDDDLYVKPSDIKEVIKPKQFEWKDVRRGMAFVRSGDLVHYIGEHLSREGWVIVRVVGGYDSYQKSDLTRAPEHDRKVSTNE